MNEYIKIVQNWSNASVCVDDANRIVGMNINNLTGNTGWQLMPENLTGKTEEEIFNYLTEEHGIPLYKIQDGTMVCRTDEEIKADIIIDDTPSQLEKLEAQMFYTAMMTDTLLEDV